MANRVTNRHRLFTGFDHLLQPAEIGETQRRTLNGDPKGDKIVTSGMGGIFPDGLPEGSVSEVMESPLGFKRAKVKPAVSLNNIREVLVLKKIESE